MCNATHSQVLAPPRDGVPGYEYKLWTDREAAPSNITAIAQTTDGYLWLGATGALYRFDGESFERPETSGASIQSVRITALEADRRNGLWIGYNWHGIAYLHHGVVTAYENPAGIWGTVSHIVVAPDGKVWAVVGNNLLLFENNTWIDVTSRYGLGPSVDWLIFHDDGTMVVSADREILEFVPGATKPVRILHTAGDVRGMTVRPDGIGMLVDNSGEIRSIVSETSPHKSVLFGKEPIGLTSDREGGLWSADPGDGICRLSPTFTQSGVLVALTRVGCVYEDGSTFPIAVSYTDRDGNIWVVGSKGLYRFQKARFVVAPIPVQLGAAFAVDPTGTLWLGTLGAPLFSYERGEWHAWGPPRQIHTIYAATDSSVWFSSAIVGSTDNLCHLLHGRIIETKPPVDVGTYPMQSLGVDGNGDVLAGFVRKGVYRLHMGKWTSMAEQFGTALMPFVMSVAPDGRVWLGFAGDRVGVWDGKRFKWISLPSNSVGSVLAFAFHAKTVWVSGENGLAAIQDGGMVRVLLTPSLAGVSGLAFSPDGDLWMNSLAGVLHTSAASLGSSLQDLKVPLTWEVIGQREGLHGQPSQVRPLQSAAFAQGRLWFSTAKAIGSVAPGSHEVGLVPPAIVRMQLASDGRRLLDADSYQLPADTRLVQVTSSAVDLSRPEDLRFAYTLNGKPVAEGSRTQQRMITFVGLPQGSYELKVAACNVGGVCSASMAALRFVIAPHFYQRQTVWMVAALTSLAFAFLFYRWRLQLVCERVEAEARGQSAERERIARELHDTLLQSVQGLALKFQAVAQGMDAGSASRSQILKYLDDADEVLASARDRVRGLRSSEHGAWGLPQRLQELIERTAEGGSAIVRLHVHCTSFSVRDQAGKELFEIGAEALRNALRHARAEHINIHLRYGLLRFSLEVVDDGQGTMFGRGGRPDAGHYGIGGMRERASLLRGSFTMRSLAGAGTLVRVVVPGAVAYNDGVIARFFSAMTRPRGRASETVLPSTYKN
ncbi:sensor histidine kinase [Bryocella elongata]|nr:histidine kinase [Bryocella elongata]